MAAPNRPPGEKPTGEKPPDDTRMTDAAADDAADLTPAEIAAEMARLRRELAAVQNVVHTTANDALRAERARRKREKYVPPSVFDPCCGCGATDHRYKHCHIPSVSGWMEDGCVKCNVKGHLYADCPTRTNSLSEEWHFVRKVRDGLAPIAHVRDWRHVANPETGEEDLTKFIPLSITYAARNVSKLTPTPFRDPSWTQESLEDFETRHEMTFDEELFSRQAREEWETLVQSGMREEEAKARVALATRTRTQSNPQPAAQSTLVLRPAVPPTYQTAQRVRVPPTSRQPARVAGSERFVNPPVVPTPIETHTTNIYYNGPPPAVPVAHTPPPKFDKVKYWQEITEQYEGTVLPNDSISQAPIPPPRSSSSRRDDGIRDSDGRRSQAHEPHRIRHIEYHRDGHSSRRSASPPREPHRIRDSGYHRDGPVQPRQFRDYNPFFEHRISHRNTRHDTYRPNYDHSRYRERSYHETTRQEHQAPGERSRSPRRNPETGLRRSARRGECHICCSGMHLAKDCPGNHRNAIKAEDDDERKCWACKSRSHKAKDCPTNPLNKKGGDGGGAGGGQQMSRR
ncbi:hypothetical protein VTL71DRAFT_5194 [Oculimacula yallundae]|uniref:CCHC-type domain-containing protein n=1 Tax=Oculimacula yallundae TaxID=86028 RepID=A0ABR4C0F2_9HELO